MSSQLAADFDAFIDLARHGVSAAADRDEQAAYRLADAAVQWAADLDEFTLKGLATFVAIAGRDVERARSLLS